MDYEAGMAILGAGGLIFYCWWNATKGMIKKIGIVQKLYPKHYITPCRCIKKLYGIKSNIIPKYLYYMCYVTIVYFFLGPVELLCYLLDRDGRSASIMMLLHLLFVIVNAIIFVISSLIFQCIEKEKARCRN